MRDEDIQACAELGGLRPTARIDRYQREFIARACANLNDMVGIVNGDDQGLGKTFMTIATICFLRGAQQWKARFLKAGPAESKAVERFFRLVAWFVERPVVVVVPSSLIGQWIDEFDAFTTFGRSAIRKYHGPGRMVDATGDVVVLTSYQTYAIEVKRWQTRGGGAQAHPLVGLGPRLVFFDEFHVLRNPCTTTRLLYDAVSRKDAPARVVGLTGTLLNNRPVEELRVLMPFIDPSFLNDTLWVPSRRAETLARVRRQHVVRRTKDQVLTLPPKRVSHVLVDPEAWEVLAYYRAWLHWEKCYNDLRDEADRKRKRGDDGGGGGGFGAEHSSAKIAFDVAQARLIIVSSDAGLDPMFRDDEFCLSKVPRPMPTERVSSKRARLTQLLRADFERMDKVLVFATYTALLDAVHWDIERELGAPDRGGPRVFRYDGRVRIVGGARDRIKAEFKALPPGEKAVMLVSTTAGGVGLNLNYLWKAYFMDQVLNPQQEQQAADRVYRRGQTHAVEIVRLSTRDTADQPIERVKGMRLENARRFTDPLPEGWDGEMTGEIAERMDVRECISASRHLFGGMAGTLERRAEELGAEFEKLRELNERALGDRKSKAESQELIAAFKSLYTQPLYEM